MLDPGITSNDVRLNTSTIVYFKNAPKGISCGGFLWASIFPEISMKLNQVPVIQKLALVFKWRMKLPKTFFLQVTVHDMHGTEPSILQNIASDIMKYGR